MVRHETVLESSTLHGVARHPFKLFFGAKDVSLRFIPKTQRQDRYEFTRLYSA